MCIVLRSEAVELGLKKYFSGVPCPKGHVADRWTSSCACVICGEDTRNRIRAVEQQQVSVATRLSPSADGTPVIITRADAKKQGLRRYYTGEVCNHGHIAERMVSNYRCLVCLQAAAKPYIHANHKRRRKVDNEFRLQHNHRTHRAKCQRLKNDPIERIKQSLRSRIGMLVRGKIKNGSAVRDLGCSVDEFRLYFESLFTGIMNWSNYGTVWEVDHIRPLSGFDLGDVSQFQEACHYTNLQPLLVEDNIRKSDMSMEQWMAIRDAIT